jgi:thiosulfate/3-mercaptopyruvate sulfurtransferase
MSHNFLIIMALVLAAASSLLADEQFSIVTPQWVAQHANDSNIRILDVRSEPADYFPGHVPNAVNFADNTVRGPKNGIPVQYLPNDMLAALLARAGVTNDDSVVVYSDGAAVLGATMVAYTLERIGHPRVMVMDGGWSDYKASGAPVTQQYPTYQNGQLTVKNNPSISITMDEVYRSMGKPGVTIIDARPPAAYAGETKSWMRSGHIPGAINIDWHTLMDPNNLHKFKPLDQIRKIYTDKGVKGTEDIILYCGTSREASLEYAVMRHMLGFQKVRLYEGSWTEWSSNPNMPVETGNPR